MILVTAMQLKLCKGYPEKRGIDGGLLMSTVTSAMCINVPPHYRIIGYHRTVHPPIHFSLFNWLQ